MTSRDLSLFYEDMPMFRSDPFAALLPFAAGNTRLRTGGPSRDMPIDVRETDKNVQIHADIPGVKKDDIHLDVDKDVLTLSVQSKNEKKEQKKEEGVTWHHSERSSTFMRRSIRMPETADLDSVSATYKDGTLQIDVPKKELPKANKRINIA